MKKPLFKPINKKHHFSAPSLMTTPKRPRYSTSNPNYSTMDTLLESLITVVTDHASIDDSVVRIFESKSTYSEQNDFIQRAMDIGSVLLEAVNRLRRKLASAHNAFVWPLPDDVTVKVFSMIDTQSVFNAGATCLYFNKCAIDPLCYADIDLVTLVPKVNDAAVSTMIQRAGNALQSIKLGVMPENLWAGGVIKSPILTSSCLSSLNGNGGSLGLRRLHLYNIKGMDNTALASLSVCPSLIDLEIVCRYVKWKLTLESVSKHIPLIERLICECSSIDDHNALEYSTCSKFVLNCPNITTLALKGFNMPDSLARKLIKGFHKLKHVDFSDTYCLTGSFLKNLGTNGGGNNLEVMILRDTTDLKQLTFLAGLFEIEIIEHNPNEPSVRFKQFLEAFLAGAWKSLRHLDISHRNGLASKHEWSDRRYSTSFLPRKQLLEQRPNFHLLAEFGTRDSESEGSSGSDSDSSSSSQSFSDTSDSSPYMSSSDSSYSSDEDQ